MTRWILGGLLVVMAATGCSSDAGEGTAGSSATANPDSLSASPTGGPSTTPTGGTPAPAASATGQSTAPQSAEYSVSGRVVVAGEPVASASVSLNIAATAQAAAQLPLASATTDTAGGFLLQAPVGELDNVYLLTSGGLTQLRPDAFPSTVVLATLLGRARPDEVVINELTTVAGAFAASEYFAGESLVGPGEVLAESATTAAGLADPATGAPGSGARSDAGQLVMLNTLANALSSCAWNEPRCAAIVAPVGRTPAATTWSGMAATAREPGEVGPIFAIQQGYPVFAPVLQEPPAAGWILLR